jgi:hypothetical protein
MSQATDGIVEFKESGQDMPRELALIKVENDSIMSAAQAKPRDYSVVLHDIESQVKTFKSFAQEAMYDKPVGTDRDGQKRFATGLSIRAAEAMAVSMGYNKIRCDVIHVDSDMVKVEASFTDFCTGRVWTDARFVSKFYKTYKGGTQRHPDDRFYDVVVGAAKSKVIREVILRCVPPGLKSSLMECVQGEISNYLDDSTMVRLITQFSNKGVSGEMLEDLIGKKAGDFNKDDRMRLVGVWNSINEGDSTIREVFGDFSGTDEGAQPDTGEKAEDIVRKVTKKKRVTKKTEAPDNIVPGHQASHDAAAADAETSAPPSKRWVSGPPPWEQLVIGFSEQNDITLDVARGRLEETSDKLFNKTLDQLDADSIESIGRNIKNKMIKP